MALLIAAALLGCAANRPIQKENPMSENRERLTQFFDQVMSRGDLNAADDYFSAGLVDHAPWPNQPPTVQGFKDGLAEFREAFPDLKADIEHVVTEGDMVVVHLYLSGSHLGPFMGAPATGKSFKVEAIDLIRMDDGRIAEHWGLIDTEKLAGQLGLAP